MIANEELQRTDNETAVPSNKLASQHLPGMTEKSHWQSLRIAEI
jgi:hypothetical protein